MKTYEKLMDNLGICKRIISSKKKEVLKRFFCVLFRILIINRLKCYYNKKIIKLFHVFSFVKC